MATWTKAELAAAALVRLGVVAIGQVASAEYIALATVKATSLLVQLRRSGLAPFDFDVIPDGAQDQIEAMLAEAMASTFGVSAERRMIVSEEAKKGRRELAAYLASDRGSLPVEVDDF